jgi:hypothetical protein
LGTDYARAFEAGEVFGLDFDFDPFFVEEDFVGELGVGFLLAGLFVHFREHFAGGLLGGFFGGDADGAARFQIDEGGGDFAPVAKFQGALAKAAIGYHCDGVGYAAIDFDVGDQALAIGDGIIDTEFAQAQHGQADAEDLASTEVAVRYRGQVEILIKRLHGAIVRE